MSDMQKISFAKAGLVGSDLFNGNPTTPAVNLGKCGEAGLLLQLETAPGAGTGKGTIVAYACDNAAKDNPVAITCKVRIATDTDKFLAVEQVTAAGKQTTPGAAMNDQYLFWANKNDLPADKPFVYFGLTEDVNDPVIGHGVLVMGKLSHLCEELPTLLT